MNSNENQNSKSITIDLENLRQKYSNLLIKYKAAVTDYVNYLNVQSQQQCSDPSANNTNCKNNEKLVSIQGKAFNGTGSAGQSTATTLETARNINGVSFTKAKNVLAMPGITNFKACGKITNKCIFQYPIPKDLAASYCPLGSA